MCVLSGSERVFLRNSDFSISSFRINLPKLDWIWKTNNPECDCFSPLEALGSEAHRHHLYGKTPHLAKITKSCAVPLNGTVQSRSCTDIPTRAEAESHSALSAVTGGRRHTPLYDWWGTQSVFQSGERFSYLVKLLLLEPLGVLRQVLEFIVFPHFSLGDGLPPPFNLCRGGNEWQMIKECRHWRRDIHCTLTGDQWLPGLVSCVVFPDKYRDGKLHDNHWSESRLYPW